MENSTNFHSHGQDPCDYPSEMAICEARRVGLSPGLPYRRGYRSRPRLSDSRTRADLKEILALNDEDFRHYIQRGCRMERDEFTDLRDTIEKLQETVRSLVARIQALPLCPPHEIQTPHARQISPAGHARGLDVPAR